jgi:hypothetical protein
VSSSQGDQFTSPKAVTSSHQVNHVIMSPFAISVSSSVWISTWLLTGRRGESVGEAANTSLAGNHACGSSPEEGSVDEAKGDAEMRLRLVKLESPNMEGIASSGRRCGCELRDET